VILHIMVTYDDLDETQSYPKAIHLLHVPLQCKRTENLHDPCVSLPTLL